MIPKLHPNFTQTLLPKSTFTGRPATRSPHAAQRRLASPLRASTPRNAEREQHSSRDGNGNDRTVEGRFVKPWTSKVGAVQAPP